MRRLRCWSIRGPRVRYPCLRRGRAVAKTGNRSQGQAGADEWHGLRPFRDGDSPRQCRLESLRPRGAVLIKEYSAMGSELRVFNFNRLTTLSTEARLEQLARWVVDAEETGDRYGLELPESRSLPIVAPNTGTNVSRPWRFTDSTLPRTRAWQPTRKLIASHCYARLGDSQRGLLPPGHHVLDVSSTRWRRAATCRPRAALGDRSRLRTDYLARCRGRAPYPFAGEDFPRVHRVHTCGCGVCALSHTQRVESRYRAC